MKNRNALIKFSAIPTSLLSGSALADVTGAEAIFTELSADATTLSGYAWPVLGLILSLLIAMGLTKKFASKSTS